MGTWVTDILSAISSFFTTLYTVHTPGGGTTGTAANNPILLCVLLPVVTGIAAFAVRLIKRRKG